MHYRYFILAAFWLYYGLLSADFGAWPFSVWIILSSVTAGFAALTGIFYTPGMVKIYAISALANSILHIAAAGEHLSRPGTALSLIVAINAWSLYKSAGSLLIAKQIEKNDYVQAEPEEALRITATPPEWR